MLGETRVLLQVELSQAAEAVEEAPPAPAPSAPPPAAPASAPAPVTVVAAAPQLRKPRIPEGGEQANEILDPPELVGHRVVGQLLSQGTGAPLAGWLVRAFDLDA